MTIRLAMEKLRDRAVLTVPVTVHGAYPQAFSFLAGIDDERMGVTRSIWFDVHDGARRGPYTNGRERYLWNIDLCVLYEGQEDHLEREIVMAEDAVRLSAQMLDDSQWDEATTGIVAISAGVSGEQDTLLPITKDRLEAGGVIQRLSMVLEVIE